MQNLPLLLLSAAVASGLLYAALTPGKGQRPAPRRLTLPACLLVLAAGLTALVVPRLSQALDHTLLSQIGQHTPALLSTLLGGFTHSGSAVFLTLLISLSVTWLLLRKDISNALLLALSGLGGALLVTVSKALIARPRPALWSTVELSSYSFPSGHTLGTAACAGALAIVATRRMPRWQPAWWSTALIWVVLIGLSRMTLGVHWPSDVLAGAVTGFALPLLLSQLPGCRQAA